MKKLRQFFCAAIIAICCMMMTSCEDMAKWEIEGRWVSEYTSGHYDCIEELYFSNSNYYSMDVDYYLNGYYDSSYYESGSYFCDGWSGLTLTYEDRYYTYEDEYTYKITGDTMVLEYYSGGEYIVKIFYRY
ncbi:MAG: hypothetical protein R3Y39_07020 [Rikenellaceae bacterium]